MVCRYCFMSNFFFPEFSTFAFYIPPGIMLKNHPTITRTKFLQDDRQASVHQSQQDMGQTGSTLNEWVTEASVLEGKQRWTGR